MFENIWGVFSWSFQSHHEFDLIAMFLLIAIAQNSMACVFIACEFSQRVNNTFNEISEKIDQLKWYLFPIKNKRMLPLIMGFVQQPIALECYGSIFCCREVFKGVSAHKPN